MPEGIRAQWHIVDADESDPFQTMVASTGTEVDLTAPTGELRATLQTLLAREGRFDSMGLTCEFKDAGQDCRTCLHPEARSKSRWPLCEVGREEAIVVDEVQGRWREKNAPLLELAEMARECSEMGSRALVEAGL